VPAGRPPKPIEQHIKEGTYRRDRHGGALVVTGDRLPVRADAPAHLSPRRRAIWSAVLANVAPIMRDSDVMMLEVVAVAWDTYLELQDEIDSMGLSFTDDKGVLRPNPLIRERDRQFKLFMDASARLGLSPADRARLGYNIANMARTATQIMADRYGDEVPDAGMEPEVLHDSDLGYDGAHD